MEAETFVALNDAVPVTLMSPNVAVEAEISSASTFVAVNDALATTRFMNVPVSFVIVDCVIPESSGCVCVEDATVERTVAMSFTPEPVGFVPL